MESSISGSPLRRRDHHLSFSYQNSSSSSLRHALSARCKDLDKPEETKEEDKDEDLNFSRKEEEEGRRITAGGESPRAERGDETEKIEGRKKEEERRQLSRKRATRNRKTSIAERRRKDEEEVEGRREDEIMLVEREEDEEGRREDGMMMVEREEEEEMRYVGEDKKSAGQVCSLDLSFSFSANGDPLQHTRSFISPPHTFLSSSSSLAVLSHEDMSTRNEEEGRREEMRGQGEGEEEEQRRGEGRANDVESHENSRRRRRRREKDRFSAKGSVLETTPFACGEDLDLTDLQPLRLDRVEEEEEEEEEEKGEKTRKMKMKEREDLYGDLQDDRRRNEREEKEEKEEKRRPSVSPLLSPAMAGVARQSRRQMSEDEERRRRRIFFSSSLSSSNGNLHRGVHTLESSSLDEESDHDLPASPPFYPSDRYQADDAPLPLPLVHTNFPPPHSRNRLTLTTDEDEEDEEEEEEDEEGEESQEEGVSLKRENREEISFLGKDRAHRSHYPRKHSKQIDRRQLFFLSSSSSGIRGNACELSPIEMFLLDIMKDRARKISNALQQASPSFLLLSKLQQREKQ
ncbi:hypothetical protein CSUI_010019, partial [Cystoisospora suis]